MRNKTNLSICKLIVVAFLVSGSGSANADFTFGTPTNLGSAINSSSTDAAPNISADGLSLYFSSNRPGGYGGWEVFVTTRASIFDPWGEPENLGPTINSSANESHTSISADGLSLYFAEGPFFDISPRPGGFGGADIWVTSRANTLDSWETPVNLGPTVNSSANDGGPCRSIDGLILVFDSDRLGGSGGLDLWMTTRSTVSDPWGPPVNLGPAVNSSALDAIPNISSDGLALFFMSNRTGNYDIWMTTRTTIEDIWSKPVNLGFPVNTSTIEATPCISANGSTLFFLSRRTGGVGGDDLWQVSITPIVDFNGDGIVDSADMRIMIDHWHTDYALCDIGPMPWGDGVIDIQDLIVLAEHLFEEVPLTH